jgi:hypothetical protein
MSTLTNFGEQFASKVLEKTYASMLTDAIANRDYEGDIKKPGDRVNILSFLNSIQLSDYAVGTDMASETIVDAEDQLVVEKRKYYNFSLDRLEDLFTYGGDIPDALITDASKVLEKQIDSYVLEAAGDAAVQNWLGVNVVVVGSGQTMASITTTATGGTITVNANNGTSYESQIGSVENPIDGNTYFAGFHANDLGKGVRLRSTSTFVSPWYKITAVTSSTVASITEWDGAASGSDFEEGYTLRGLFGGDGTLFPKYGDGNASLLTMSSLGWEFQAAAPTGVSAASIYDQTTLLAQALDDAEVADTDRKLTVPSAVLTALKQSAELQPTGIAEIFSGTVLNGRVMRFGGFDVHMAAGSRVSTRAGHPTSSTTGPSADLVLSSSNGYQILANHIGFVTYADKWSESRVVDAENQFAKKYQGLFLYGKKVPAYRRKYGAVLFGSV